MFEVAFAKLFCPRQVRVPFVGASPSIYVSSRNPSGNAWRDFRFALAKGFRADKLDRGRFFDDLIVQLRCVGTDVGR